MVASTSKLNLAFSLLSVEMFFLCENVAVSEAGGNEFPTPESFLHGRCYYYGGGEVWPPEDFSD